MVLRRPRCPSQATVGAPASQLINAPRYPDCVQLGTRGPRFGSQSLDFQTEEEMGFLTKNSRGQETAFDAERTEPGGMVSTDVHFPHE